MPELPEVHTTSQMLNDLLPGKKIVSVWTSYKSKYYKGKESIKDSKYFEDFKKIVSGKKIIAVRRRAKNVLIDISGDQTILIHMKMTGHLLYGIYEMQKKGKAEEWLVSNKEKNENLRDKMNGWIRLVFELSNGKHLVLSDLRKFASVKLITDKNAHKKFLDSIGPEPLEKEFDLKQFSGVLNKRPNGRIKNILMDPAIISGIGNIYSDEALWLSGINPETLVKNIETAELKNLLKNIKKVLHEGIDFGGDSMSDYRRPDGSPGQFQLRHQVYQRKGEKCKRKGCNGTIVRKKVGGRSAHFCDTHQKLYI